MPDTNDAPASDPAPSAARPARPQPKKQSMWEVYYPRNVHEEKEAVPIASFPMIIYFWPTMVVFFALGVIQSAFGGNPETLGLWAVALWSLNLFVIVADLDQKKFLIAVLLLGLVGAGLWISALKDWGFAESLGRWLDSLDVQFSSQAYFLLSAVVFTLTLLGLMTPRFDYWRFEANEFVHYIQPWGRDQSIPRTGSTVAREVPDVLEFLLTFGGGSIVVKREGQVVARIEHVPFLGRRMIALEKLLSATRVQAVD